MEQKNRNLTQQEKSISLFEFIRELNKLKQKVVLNMREYLLCRPLSELPVDPEHIHVAYRDRVEEEYPEMEQSNVLLSVRKPRFEACPVPGENLERWLIGGWDSWKSDAEHHAYLPIENSDEKEPELKWFSDDPELVRSFEAWKELRSVWADRQRLRAKTLDLFNDLYKRYFELERNPETLELIVSNGILMDRNDPAVCHPVLTKRVKMRFDPDENTIYLEEVEGQSELYSVVFQTMDDINLSTINQLQDDLRQNDYHPLDRNEMPGFLKVLVHQLSSDSIYSAAGVSENWKKQGRLLLYTDPCYILRRRLDGTPKAIERIIEQIKTTGFVPAPIGDIVSGGRVEIPEDTGEMTIEQQLAAVGGESADILLAKEANSEQLEIAKRIKRYNAVLARALPARARPTPSPI